VQRPVQGQSNTVLNYITPQSGGPLRRCGTWLTTLPILYNHTLIGRIDPKAHRKEGIFKVKALHLEPGVVIDDALAAEVKAACRPAPDFELLRIA
jgi:uncharacterized protein YcaQ